MKKFLAILLSITMLTVLSAGCAKNETPVTEEKPAAETAEPVPETETVPEETAEKTTVRIAGLKGPTSLGLLKLIDDGENGLAANNYEFTLAGTADEITPLFVKGELDVIAAPINLASVLYNKTEGAVRLMAINTLGEVSIVENGESIEAMADLAGKTIYATGKGSVPEYALRYILEGNGIDPDEDVNIEFKSEPTEIVALMGTEKNVVAMLPQPYVTVAKGQVEGLRVVFDLTEEWDKLENGSRFLTAGLIVRTEFAADNPEAVAALLDEYEASAAYINENVADGAQLAEKYGITKAAVAEKAIPYCNIVCITGDEMINDVQNFMELLYAQNPAAVGGSLPDDAFYYVK